MLLPFLLGVLVSATICWFFWFSCRREAIRASEEKERLLQERKIVLDFMHTMVEAIGEGIDRQELFQRVVHSAVLSTGALSACIFERRGDYLTGVAVQGLFPPHRPLPKTEGTPYSSRAGFMEQVLKSESFAVGEGLVGACAQTGSGILIDNALHDPRVVKHEDPALKVRSAIVVPIGFGDSNIAVLAIVNPVDGGRFTETDFSLAGSLAEQAGMAIHSLDLMQVKLAQRKLDVDLALARNIQSMLLPRDFPKMETLQIGAHYQPAQDVGGDLYDVFVLDENRLGLAVADVSGKGIPASILMAICQGNIRHLARRQDSPAAVLRELNIVMNQEMRAGMYVTVVYAVVYLREEMLLLARAGHELPIHLQANSETGGRVETRFLGTDGMAVGMVPNDIFAPTIRDVRVPFRRGDILLLYTDGVTEAVNDEGLEFGGPRLADALKQLRTQDPDSINAALANQVKLFSSGQALRDDLTMLTVKRR